MRGVAGILFVSVGFMVAYLVLSGKLPNSGNLINPPIKPLDPTQGRAAPIVQGGTPPGRGQAQHGTGSGPGALGLPTMGYFHDLVASRGGMT